MNKRKKPTTTPALIDQAKKCTSSKDVIQTLFSTKHVPNSLERKEAKKIFLKEGIPWPSARGRHGKPKAEKPNRAQRLAQEIAKLGNGDPYTDPDPEFPPDPIPRSPVAFCPACGTGIYDSVDGPCEGCKRDLFIEIHTRTIYTVTAK